MSWRLTQEVLDHAPEGLSYAERYLLIVLAERADDETRTCWPGPDELMGRMRVDTWDAVAKVLRGLARRGLEVRVPYGTDRHGRQVVAGRGHRTVYRIPRFADRSREHAANFARSADPAGIGLPIRQG